MVFVIVVDLIAEYAGKRLINKILCANDLVLMIESREFERKAFEMQKVV